MSSEAFERFKKFYFVSDRDGPDTESLLSLEGDERSQAEEFLLEALAKGNSWEAPVGLGVLRSQRAAEPIKELFRQTSGPRVDLALALWRIEQWPEAFEELVRVLRARPAAGEDGDDFIGEIHSSDRIDAALALQEVRTAESVEVLVEALDDPFDLVRANAVTSLAIMCGPYPVIESHQTGIMSDDPKKREETKQSILALIKRGAPSPLAEDYEIGFVNPIAYEYLLYREGSRRFVFHVHYSEEAVTVRMGNYLTGMLGDPREFAPGEKERIKPRLRHFFEQQQMVAQIVDLKHNTEPEQWAQKDFPVVMPGKPEALVELSLLTVPVLRIRSSRLPICGALLAGAAGAVIGAFSRLLFDTTKWSPWISGLLFAVIGAWLGRKFQQDADDANI